MNIEKSYKRLLENARNDSGSDYFVEITEQFADGYWKDFEEILSDTGLSFRDKSVVDFGCKFGHLLIYFLSKGAKLAIGVEAEPSYIEEGKRFLETDYCDRLYILESYQGCVDIPTNSVDFVFLNEVISHVQPNYLPTVYAEVARILKVGSHVFISDWNNADDAKYVEDLWDLWEAWENGPAGRTTDHDTVTEPYNEARRNIIRKNHPELDLDRVQYLANNTSGLYGDMLIKVVDRYIETGVLIERPYRPGTYPTYPGRSGVVMERTFFSRQIEMELAGYVIQAHQLHDTNAPFHVAIRILGRKLSTDSSQ